MICAWKSSCAVKSSWQSAGEISRPTVHSRHWERTDSEQHQQQVLLGNSSLEFSGSPNLFHNWTLTSQIRRLGYAPALEFRSFKIIDLLPQDKTAAESKVYSLHSSNTRNGNPLQQSSTSFIYAHSSQNVWQGKEFPSVRRGDIRVRAERVSRKPRKESSDYWEKTEDDDYGGIEGSSIWDANAENVRRRRSRRMYYSTPEVGEPRSPARERNNKTQKDEWDYDSEPTYKEEPKAFRNWPSWFPNADADNSDDDEDDEDEDPIWLSWMSADLKDVFLLMRWGLPAAFLLATAVLPWMIGNPVIILLGFLIFPSASKFFNPLAKELFSYLVNPFVGPSFKRKRKRSTTRSTSRYTDARDNFGSQSRPLSGRSYGGAADYEVSREEVRSGRSSTSKLGGWEDLVEEDITRDNSESKWPLQKVTKSGKKLVRKVQPLYIRTFLAFFPFLRGWGGLL